MLNSAVIASGAFGRYEYRPMTRDEARAWVLAGPYRSAVGYPETAQYIARHLDVPAPALSRDASPLAAGDEALVVRLRYRMADPTAKGRPTGARDSDWELGLLRREI